MNQSGPPGPGGQLVNFGPSAEPCKHGEAEFGFDFLATQGQPYRLAFRVRCKICRARFRFAGIAPLEDQPHPLAPATQDRLNSLAILPIVPLGPRETAMLDAVMPWPPSEQERLEAEARLKHAEEHLARAAAQAAGGPEDADPNDPDLAYLASIEEV